MYDKHNLSNAASTHAFLLLFLSACSFSNSVKLRVPSYQPPAWTLPLTNSLNEADLGNSNLWSNSILPRQNEVELVGEEVYYRSIVLFVERIEIMVAFKDVSLVKANISNSLRGSAPEWCKKLSNFDRNALDNDRGMSTWIQTLLLQFKICPDTTLGLLVDAAFLIADVRRRRPPSQYVKTIVRYYVGSNIVEEAKPACVHAYSVRLLQVDAVIIGYNNYFPLQRSSCPSLKLALPEARLAKVIEGYLPQTCAEKGRGRRCERDGSRSGG